MTAEHRRLQEAREYAVPWRKWGPYLSERQWGTVREDYSEGGDAWNYFTHDQARSRAYRWGEAFTKFTEGETPTGPSKTHERPLLSDALSNQHARLVDRTVPGAGALRHPG